MSFKSSLEALFKLSGSQAMPSNERTTQEITPSGDWLHFVAPYDGYFTVSTSGDGGNANSLEITNASSQIQYKMPAIPPTYVGASVVCKKGDAIDVLIGGATGSSRYSGTFVKLVGQS